MSSTTNSSGRDFLLGGVSLRVSFVGRAVCIETSPGSVLCTPEMAAEHLEAISQFIRRQSTSAPSLRQLLERHGIYGHQDPGGVELHHPVHGKFRISGCDDAADYNDVVRFLLSHNVEP